MIPKIIHYTWFSGDPFPAPVKKCIDSWHKYMPDWDYMLWDAERIKVIDSVWVSECLREHKWAFAADYVRLYAIYHYGGIYLDCDCLLHQSIEPFIKHTAFIGQEWYVHIDCYTTQRFLTAHCFGAEPNHLFVGRCLRYYDSRHFIRSFQRDLPAHLRYDQTLLPEIMAVVAIQLYGYDPRPSHDDDYPKFFSNSTNGDLAIYPLSYFDFYGKKAYSCCQHLALAAWNDRPTNPQKAVTIRYRVWYHLDKLLHRILWYMGYILTNKQ